MKFVIPIAPRPQKRARSGAFVIKGGGKWGQDIARAQTYTDKDQRTEQNKLMALMYEHRPPEPLQGPLLLGVKAYLPIPKSKPKKWQAAALAGAIRPTTKPDNSNLAKNIEDVMNGVFFVDDRQIVTLSVEKWYGEPARWEISLERYQTLLREIVGEPQAELPPLPVGNLGRGVDAFGPSVSCGKGKVSLETQQVSGRLF